MRSRARDAGWVGIVNAAGCTLNSLPLLLEAKWGNLKCYKLEVAWRDYHLGRDEVLLPIPPAWDSFLVFRVPESRGGCLPIDLIREIYYVLVV
jgi:hypothetical protein